MSFKPEEHGKGMWELYHLAACHVKSDSDINAIIYLTKIFSKKFRCEKCRSHFKKISQKHDVQKYATKDKIFEYTVIVHNIVNKLLGKKQYSVKEALKIYL